MKNLLLMLSLLFAVVNNASAHAWRTLTIATTEYPPYTSTDMEHNGYINHIISEAFLRVGVDVVYETMSWEDAIASAKDGRYDAVSYANFTRVYSVDFWQSEPITSESLVFTANEELPLDKWENLQQLEQYKIGVTKGYAYTDELFAFFKQSPNTVTVNTDKDGLNAVIANDIQLFPIDELTAWYLLERDFTTFDRDEIKMLKPFISTVTTHLLIPRKSQDGELILALFNKGLRELAMEGKLDRYKTLLREGYYQHPDKPVNFDRR
ncbi:ABC transporter substrate-binding protein [uncultured Alteromonas sp.]|jgi:polar amino acid transport system substrate-binding protein|uniref:substrate-binding periplasmic protein n=1 Tax=uncultured Alteromonas sp. TaxID=179113 RepID=UPI0025F7B44B|nr:transporter substrate-binding domain-containing protein [uncultured Alteromonas sp.]